METPLIELKNITFKYQSEDTKNALNDVSLNIYPGEWVASVPLPDHHPLDT